jgi:hypothetical protein
MIPVIVLKLLWPLFDLKSSPKRGMAFRKGIWSVDFPSVFRES